jgi:hypothetical protein
MTSEGHVYERHGDVFTPTSWAGSPWSADLQHGGPVNALFSLAAEEAARVCEMRVVRLTVDLFRPVPLEPVEFMPRAMRNFVPPGFHWSFEVRMGSDEHGPAAWIRTPLDLLPDAPMTPLQRCAAVCDLTYGLSGRSLLRQRIAEVDAWRAPMINTDTTIYWEREPVGEWFGFRHALLTDHEGIGLAEVDLADTTGRLGRSLQAMLANPVPPRASRGNTPSSDDGAG